MIFLPFFENKNMLLKGIADRLKYFSFGLWLIISCIKSQIIILSKQDILQFNTYIRKVLTGTKKSTKPLKRPSWPSPCGLPVWKMCFSHAPSSDQPLHSQSRIQNKQKAPHLYLSGCTVWLRGCVWGGCWWKGQCGNRVVLHRAALQNKILHH